MFVIIKIIGGIFILKEDFEKVLNEYPDVRLGIDNNASLIHFINTDFKEHIEQHIDNSNFYVTTSLDDKKLDEIPWISIKNKNQKLNLEIGYYFRKDMNGVYIIFRVFLSDLLIERNDSDLFIPILISKKDSIKDFLHDSNLVNKTFISSIDLKVHDSDFVDLIENGAIFSKFYDAKEIPSDDYLIDDLNLFLTFYNNTLNNYIDDTEISVEEWITVLKDKTVINEPMFNILKILYSLDDYAGFTTDISKGMEELGDEPKRTYGPQFIYNGKRVQNKLKKRPVINLNSRKDPNYITRFFYRHKINQREKFQLRDELVEALEKINLTRTNDNPLDNFTIENDKSERIL